MRSNHRRGLKITGTRIKLVMSLEGQKLMMKATLYGDSFVQFWLFTRYGCWFQVQSWLNFEEDKCNFCGMRNVHDLDFDPHAWSLSLESWCVSILIIHCRKVRKVKNIFSSWLVHDLDFHALCMVFSCMIFCAPSPSFEPAATCSHPDWHPLQNFDLFPVQLVPLLCLLWSFLRNPILWRCHQLQWYPPPCDMKEQDQQPGERSGQLCSGQN